ncbi:MarR family winged helix-turn-helix transcriptional regulator [Smaragdicoccus niigatensis]|uniref:MarR family winged helix-turn-helix transcriptional regulator n=1 Tax=Smaragdicoccus niigatensis TaxID=359359 RepID=UPI00037616CD|nr:MarR family winged helix-turn-helix transcriptional regulator [Smaragdicoccus niigatensis]
MVTPEPTALVPGSLGDHALCMLQKLGQIAFRLTEEKLSEQGLRIRHYSVLQALDDLDGASQAELSSYLRIDAATMVACIDELEKRTFVTRGRDPKDRRRYRIELTSQGADALVEANSGLEDLQREALGDLSVDNLEALTSALAALNTSGTLSATFERTRRVTAAS